jgi:hypothetical protein
VEATTTHLYPHAKLEGYFKKNYLKSGLRKKSCDLRSKRRYTYASLMTNVFSGACCASRALGVIPHRATSSVRGDDTNTIKSGNSGVLRIKCQMWVYTLWQV